MSVSVVGWVVVGSELGVLSSPCYFRFSVAFSPRCRYFFTDVACSHHLLSRVFAVAIFASFAVVFVCLVVVLSSLLASASRGVRGLGRSNFQFKCRQASCDRFRFIDRRAEREGERDRESEREGEMERDRESQREGGERDIYVWRVWFDNIFVFCQVLDF